MPKGWKSPVNDDTVFFSSESLSAGSEIVPDQDFNSSSPSKKERKRKEPKSISRSYRLQSTTISKGKGVGVAIVICLLIWLIFGISTGLIGQFWYWILPLIAIISGIRKGSRTRSAGRRRRRY
jgi:hypothetical protein